ncbi:hypothetical protein BH23ACT9_BH23ACT9_18800 [soil metagenome]
MGATLPVQGGANRLPGPDRPARCVPPAWVGQHRRVRYLPRGLPLLLLALVTACSSAGTGSGAAAPDGTGSDVAATTAADGGLEVTTLLEGLRGPTQIAMHPDGRLLVAEIGEGEGTPTGTVTAIDLDDPSSREVLVAGLDTPTGVTVAGGALWVMERTRLVTAPLTGGAVTVIYEDLPSNGRSNGTLTTLADGRLLFDTSGRRMGFDAAPGSGVLWAIDPTDAPEGSPDAGYGTPLLAGMKHAYAVAELDDGRLAVTEMSDGRFDGSPAPDELMVIDPDRSAGLTGGWPRCVGDRIPVVEFDGTAEECAATIGSVGLFEPGATPTGVAIAPWDASIALVALWTRGTVVAVPLAGAAADGEVQVSGIDTPQHLLVDGDRVLVTSHGDGLVLALQPG